jgi:TPP-dependent pyruvate/acetoin dehydrogenase alpha subunit
LEAVHSLSSPQALILHTARFGPHSKGDDTRATQEVEWLRQERDPLTIHASRLEAESRRLIESQVEMEITEAFQDAQSDPYPTLTLPASETL